MCKACVTVKPTQSLSFFIPHLCEKIEEKLHDRVQDNMPDRELQYALTLLSEVISVRGGLPTAKTDSNPLVPYIEDICTRVLDKTLYLKQKDEYELASGILEGLLYNLVHVRQVQRFPAQEESAPIWSRDKFKWAKAGNLVFLPFVSNLRSFEPSNRFNCGLKLAKISFSCLILSVLRLLIFDPTSGAATFFFTRITKRVRAGFFCRRSQRGCGEFLLKNFLEALE